MKILLVRPPRIKQSINLTEIMFAEPIGLEMVYAVLSKNHEVDLVDLMVETTLEIEEVLKQKNYDVVGITSLCIDVMNVLDLAKRVKAYKQETKVFVGGTQAYLVPQAFFSPDVDFIYKFTNPDNLQNLMSQLEEAQLETKQEELTPIEGIYMKAHDFTAPKTKGYNTYILPDRECTKKYRSHYSYFGYSPCAIMGTSMGCSKHCDFCLRWRIEGACESYRPLEEVIAEIESIQEESIMIYDNDFLHHKDRLAQFCNALEERGISKNFICYGSVKSILDNIEEVRRFGTLGLRAVLVGYESFDNEELKKYHKKSTIHDNLEAAKLLKEAHIDCWASFIAHPDWDKADFKALRKYIYKLEPENTTISPLTPFETLPIYKKYEDRLLYKPEEYAIWSFGNVVIRPSKMSVADYYKEMFKTVVYVNIRTNRPLHMVRQYGLKNMIRLAKGAMKLSRRYKQLTKDF